MPRLLGVEIPSEKRIEASLTYVYGIGPSTAKRVLEQTNIDPNLRAKDLTPQQINEIIQTITDEQAFDRRRSAPGIAKQPEAFAGDQLLSRRFAIAEDCQCAVSGRRRMRARARDHARLWVSSGTRTQRQARFSRRSSLTNLSKWQIQRKKPAKSSRGDKPKAKAPKTRN